MVCACGAFGIPLELNSFASFAFSQAKPYVGADIPVPGYAGFRPSYTLARLALGEKSPHIGRPISQAEHDLRVAEGVEESGFDGKTTEYSATYGKIQPADTSPFKKTGGGYTLTERQVPSPKPFIATSSYQAELLNGYDTARKQLQSSQGLRSTMVQYEAARQSLDRPRTAGDFSSPRSITAQRAGIAMTASGEIAGYQTTTGNALSSAAAMLAKRSASLTPQSSPEPRWKSLPPAMAPGMFGSTPTSRIDYGEDGSDPADRAAPSQFQMSRMSTTRDLNEGSVLNTSHPPGYTGHTPSSKYHVLARQQAEGADVRSPKHYQYAYSLDQFVREGLEVPGSTLFKPQDVLNRKVESKTPTEKTTYGEQNAQVVRAVATKKSWGS
jgi:hypothetical protein